MTQLPHDWQTCNCGACKLIRLDIKVLGHTERSIPCGPASELHTPPSKRQAKTPGKPKPHK